MLNKKAIISFTILIVLQLFIGCSSVKNSEQKVSEKKVELFFTESDSEIIADSVVNKVLITKWDSQYTYKRKPRIIVGSITDLTNEKIDVNLLSKNIERSFINSGKVTFIVSKNKREEIRNNRKNRADFISDAEFKSYLKPLNSDFFVSGSLSLLVDSTMVPIQKEYSLVLEVTKSKSANVIFSRSTALIK
jgi:PBP1b-binding outer membrane lipoprotein LpoB